MLSFQDPTNCPLESRNIKRASDFLGSNNHCVIFDAWGGFDPDAFGIISGTINGGGLKVLITPTLDDWPAYPDPDNKRLAVHPLQAADVTGNYLSRINRIISDELPVLQYIDNIKCRLLLTQATSAAPSQALPNDEQLNLIRVIDNSISQVKLNPPILVTADRGRGKSTALGLVAGKLLKQASVSNVIVTAPGKSSLNTFFQHADNTLEGSTELRPTFVPTDVLVRDLPKACLLIIDEAAAIALPLLLKLIKSYSRCILSSTLHGYEGSGRGFALRLRSLLNSHYSGWQELQLTRPVRFAPKDPLEHFTARLLMLNATISEFKFTGYIDTTKCQLEELSPTFLERDEKTLAELFALLVQAHYQTKPLDLKHLLDGPNIRIFVLTHERRIVAAVLLATEQIAGDKALQDAIIHGERRPRGHLLSQLLAYQNLNVSYLELKIARIVRIAVAPQLQSKLLGSFFLERLFNYCSSESFDAVGASFGATTELLHFWNKNQYKTLHLGFKRNASSASYSAVVFREISQRAKLLSEISSNNFIFSLRFRHRYIKDTQLLESISRQSGSFARKPIPSFTKAVVASYTHRHRDFESSHAELHRYLGGINLQSANLSASQQQALELIILRCNSWSSTSKILKLQGRKDCENLIKAALLAIEEQS